MSMTTSVISSVTSSDKVLDFESPFEKAKLSAVDSHIKSLVYQKDYPCVGALRAVKKGEYRIGIYEEFGKGTSSKALKNDLLNFLAEQKKTNSPYLSFWASFPEDFVHSEEDFENRLWQELSSLSSLDIKSWDPNFSSNPDDKNFCFSLDGSAFFVVGLHSKSSRRSRTFPYPSMIFNLYDQFEIITRMNQYESMVQTNRKKGLRFEGDVNPMVEKYGDRWEAIQFSGRQNDDTWKCPFHRFMKGVGL